MIMRKKEREEQYERRKQKNRNRKQNGDKNKRNRKAKRGGKEVLTKRKNFGVKRANFFYEKTDS